MRLVYILFSLCLHLTNQQLNAHIYHYTEIHLNHSTSHFINPSVNLSEAGTRVIPSDVFVIIHCHKNAVKDIFSCCEERYPCLQIFSSVSGSLHPMVKKTMDGNLGELLNMVEDRVGVDISKY